MFLDQEGAFDPTAIASAEVAAGMHIQSTEGTTAGDPGVLVPFGKINTVSRKTRSRCHAQSPELAERCSDFSADRGLDSAETKAMLWDDYDIRPFIDTRQLWREEKQHPRLRSIQVLAVMMAMALGHVLQGRIEQMRSLVRPIPIPAAA